MKIFKNVLLALMLMSSLMFAKSVGTVTSLKGSATITRDGVEIEAKLGTKIDEKDTLKTKEKSQVQIIFDDETVITVGNNSSFSVNEYLFEENKAPSAKFGLLKGAMKTITGKIGKMAPENFKVQTKTATIGIRGTHFTVIAQEDGGFKIYCTFGAITVTSDGEETTVEQGFYISVSPDGKQSDPIKFTPAELESALSEAFLASEETQDTPSASQQDGQSASNEPQNTNTTSSSTEETTSNVTPQYLITSMDLITQMEITSIEHIGIMLTDVESLITISAQTETLDTIEESVEPEPTPTEPEPTEPEPVPTEPEPEPTEPEPTPTEPEPVPTEPEPTPTEPEPEPTPTEPEPTPTEPEPTPTEPTPTPAPAPTPTVVFTTNGQTVAYRNNNEGYEQFYYNLPTVSSTVSLTALSTSVFDTASSYIKISDYVDGFTWSFTPASTLTGTVASGAFSGTFASISSTNPDIANISIASSAFSVTSDDLSPDDLMSWGEWNTAFTYDESGVASSATFKGLWVGGESITPSSVIQNYTSTTPIVYDGIYKALLFSDTAIATTSTGTATLTVDFGQDTASLTVGTLATFSDMPIVGSSFASPASHATANGTFYGADGKEAAGSFSIMTDQYVPVAEGVYQVSTTQTPQ